MYEYFDCDNEDPNIASECIKWKIIESIKYLLTDIPTCGYNEVYRMLWQYLPSLIDKSEENKTPCSLYCKNRVPKLDISFKEFISSGSK